MATSVYLHFRLVLPLFFAMEAVSPYQDWLTNDPKFNLQFHLRTRMNIIEAWRNGYTGRNITICIHEATGIDFENPDLSSKFVREASYNFQVNNTLPFPSENINKKHINGHGTWMAGIAAGKANNGFCGVGVAFDAKLSALKLLQYDPRWSRELLITTMGRSLRYKYQLNDIYSCSWGINNEFGTNIGYANPIAKQAMTESVEKGRGGRGSIFVKAAGNGGMHNGSCCYDEFSSSIQMITISLVTARDTCSILNEACAGISAVTYASEGFRYVGMTGDLMPTAGLGKTCTNDAVATSAATAVASGIFALLLEANPNLGWRDVQHLIAHTSNRNITNYSSITKLKWKKNKAGFDFTDWTGFGILDADALTRNGKNWTNVGPQIQCTLDFAPMDRIDGVHTTEKLIDMRRWPAHCPGNKRINYLEHVVVAVNLNFTYRQNLELSMESPGPNGTQSVFLRSGRFRDRNREIRNLSIKSLHFWGEPVVGVWRMRLRNVQPNSSRSGHLRKFSVTFYGTHENPMGYNHIDENHTDVKSGPTNGTQNKSHTGTVTQIPSTTKISPKPKQSTKTSDLVGKRQTVLVKQPITKNGGGKSQSKIIVVTICSVAVLVTVIVALFIMKRIVSCYKTSARPLRSRTIDPSIIKI